MVWIGIGILTLMILGIVLRFLRSKKEGSWSVCGLLGLMVILVSEWLLWKKVHFVELYFIPLVWTGYILLVDAAVFRLTSRSRLHESLGNFLWLVLWSIPLWVVFEAYNLHLKNWVYLNLPQDAIVRYVGYAWAFGTIWPALFETTDLLVALRVFQADLSPGIRIPSRRLLGFSVAVGFGMLVIPVTVPRPAASYLFGFVWLGMIFAFDPINYWLGKRSVWLEWLSGRRQAVYSMLLAGLFCGLLWEFWNYWAVARWEYIFPIMQRFKIFEMPLAGYLGFPPFCVECFVMYELVNFRSTKSQVVGGASTRSLLVDY